MRCLKRNYRGESTVSIWDIDLKLWYQSVAIIKGVETEQKMAQLFLSLSQNKPTIVGWFKLQVVLSVFWAVIACNRFKLCDWMFFTAMHLWTKSEYLSRCFFMKPSTICFVTPLFIMYWQINHSWVSCPEVLRLWVTFFYPELMDPLTSGIRDAWNNSFHCTF